MNLGTTSAILFLYVLTLAAQLFSLAFGRIDPQQDFSSFLLPSLMFLSVLTLPACWFGLTFGQRLGLGAPALMAVFRGQTNSWQNLWQRVKWVIPSAVLIGICLLLLREVTQPYLPAEIKDYGYRGVLGGLAVSIGAAVAEEIWFRLGLMTFIIWVISKLGRQHQPSGSIVWFTIVISATAFAAAHLPQLISYGAGSPFAIAGTMFGNIVVGVFFGWIYWRKGLLAAITGHLFVDLVLHVFPAVYWGM